MAEGSSSRQRAAFKFVFWALCAAALFALVAHWHRTGQFAAWFYHSAATGGYAVNANVFKDATKDKPAMLDIGPFSSIEGLQAVPVKKGDRLPANANGVISDEVLKKAKRASLVGGQIKVTVPWEIQQAKGFKYKDTFKHKGVHTYPWAAVVNILLIAGLGVTLGFMAEGFTDLLGIKFEKIRHFEGH
jgi:hypothetical protein